MASDLLVASLCSYFPLVDFKVLVLTVGVRVALTFAGDVTNHQHCRLVRFVPVSTSVCLHRQPTVTLCTKARRPRLLENKAQFIYTNMETKGPNLFTNMQFIYEYAISITAVNAVNFCIISIFTSLISYSGCLTALTCALVQWDSGETHLHFFVFNLRKP